MSVTEIALAGYLAFGQLIPSGQQEIVKHAGLQVIHADGAVTLRLKESSRKEIPEPGARHVAVFLEDETRPPRGPYDSAVFELTRPPSA